MDDDGWKFYIVLGLIPVTVVTAFYVMFFSPPNKVQPTPTFVPTALPIRSSTGAVPSLVETPSQSTGSVSTPSKALTPVAVVSTPQSLISVTPAPTRIVHIDRRNYDAKQNKVNHPDTYLWCTFFLSEPGVKPITVMIHGDLTSSNRQPANPTTDGILGNPSSFEYGFMPGQRYTKLSQGTKYICFDEFTAWQKKYTEMVP